MIRITDILEKRSAEHPDRLAYRFLQDGETTTQTISYSTLFKQVKQVAQQLMLCTSKGDRALLLYPSGIDFVIGFLACLYAGVIAVPAYPPRFNRSFDRTLNIVDNCTPTIILSTKSIIDSIQEKFDGSSFVSDAFMMATDIIQGTCDISPRYHDIAFLQYTSGSTSAPKGVKITHENIMANEAMIKEGFGLNFESQGVGWLPVFHDMGLIGKILQSLFVGGKLTFMPPSAFLQKPIRWLRAISDYQCAVSGGPNFAYEHCIDKISLDDMAGLDLSCWKNAFNGSEGVHYQTIQRFSDKFSEVGFSLQAFTPCFGMAETTLYVSGDWQSPPFSHDLKHHPIPKIETSQYAANDYRIVSSGTVNKALQTVKIVDPETLIEQAPYSVGEIWVAGPHVAAGYWENETQTQSAFNAYTQAGEGPFLRTGDLGFINPGHHIFIAGRIKDVIILRGSNYYPQDIEYTLERVDSAFNKGSAAAFGIEDQSDTQLVCVVELNRAWYRKSQDTLRELAEKAVGEINLALQIRLQRLVFIRPNTAPKTSSGKIQRAQAKHLLLNHQFKIIFDYDTKASSSQPSVSNSNQTNTTIDLADLQEMMKQWIGNKINKAPHDIDMQLPFDQFGIDSVSLTDFSNEIENYAKVSISMDMLYEHPTIQSLSLAIQVSLAAPENETSQKTPPHPTEQNRKEVVLPVFDQIP